MAGSRDHIIMFHKDWHYYIVQTRQSTGRVTSLSLTASIISEPVGERFIRLRAAGMPWGCSLTGLTTGLVSCLSHDTRTPPGSEPLRWLSHLCNQLKRLAPSFQRAYNLLKKKKKKISESKSPCFMSPTKERSTSLTIQEERPYSAHASYSF